jgi:site-specific DNA-methyltransferase (adenine-specific)
LIHDGSEEVMDCFPEAPGQMADASSSDSQRAGQRVYGQMKRGSGGQKARGDSGSAARFFYCAKSSRRERGADNDHPTVKPLKLMRYLCRLVTPPGGMVLDPYCGSGTTGMAAVLEGFRFTGCELDARHAEVASRRIDSAIRKGGCCGR